MLRITKSVWVGDWYCGKRVKSTNCCAKNGWFKSASATLGGLIHLMQEEFLRTLLCQGKSTRPCVTSVKTIERGGGVSFLKVMTSLHSSEETSKSTRSSFGFFAFRASRRCPRLNLPTGEWGNGTGCGSANKKFWGSLRHWCEWVPANSCIKVIQEIWNRPVRSNSRNDPTFVHWIYRSLGVEEILAKSTHPPEQWRGRCPADRCQRSYTEDNGKVCYARDKARCHWRRWFPSSLCRTQKWK